MTLINPVHLLGATGVGPVHFIAIGGAGMSGIASLYHQLGVPTSGCDQTDSATLRHLAAEGIQVYVGHDVAQLAGIQTVVRSTAIRSTNVELIEAKARGLRIWHRSTALGALMLGRRGVSVAGSHGKSTTTAMIALMLAAAGADPSYVVGAQLANGQSAHLGAGDVFVVEADESDGSFLQYPTEIAVITNIEADHLDNWGSPQAYADGFARFATQPGVRAVVINNDDLGARTLAQELIAVGSAVVTYGSSPDSDVRLSHLNFDGTDSRARLTSREGTYDLILQVPGRHNLDNAAAAFATGVLLGLDPVRLLSGAAEFTGTLRRFQLVGAVGGIRVYDDYAHHPTEIRAALTAARRVAGSGRLVACFQPHLYSRTRDFATEFGQALCLADVVVVTDVYPSREDPLPGVTGELVADFARDAAAAAVFYVADKAELPDALADLIAPDDVVMILGAGDVTLVGPLLVARLTKRLSPMEG